MGDDQVGRDGPLRAMVDLGATDKYIARRAIMTLGLVPQRASKPAQVYTANGKFK